jgi:hypothetical protein
MHPYRDFIMEKLNRALADLKFYDNNHGSIHNDANLAKARQRAVEYATILTALDV